MFILNFDIKESKPFDIGARRWGKWSKNAFEQIGRRWHKEVLPEHANPSGSKKHPHKKRQSKYRKSKQRAARRGGTKRNNVFTPVVMGGVVDNVFSGDMMRALLRTKIVKAFPTRLTVTSVGPKYLNTNFVINQPDKKQELTHLTRNQKRSFITDYKRSMVKQWRKFKHTRTKRI